MHISTDLEQLFNYNLIYNCVDFPHFFLMHYLITKNHNGLDINHSIINHGATVVIP